MRTFGKDRQILDFIKIYAPFSSALNLRVYTRALELKNSLLDWKKSVIDDLHIEDSLFEIYNLLRTYKTDKERESHFSKSRAEYYRTKKSFLSKNPKFVMAK